MSPENSADIATECLRAPCINYTNERRDTNELVHRASAYYRQKLSLLAVVCKKSATKNELSITGNKSYNVVKSTQHSTETAPKLGTHLCSRLKDIGHEFLIKFDCIKKSIQK